MTAPRPSHIWTWILQIVVRDDEGARVSGDLAEIWAARARRDPRAANAWYRRQVVGFILRFPADSALRGARSALAMGRSTQRKMGMTKMTGLWNDARFALRGLVRAPGFTAITIGTLALGIGATTAIFSVVNGVLLKPLPFEDADELVGVWLTAPGLGFDEFPLSEALYFTYRDENRVFEDIGSWSDGVVSVTGLAEPEQVSAMRVTAGLFPLLRVRPLIGRPLTEDDDSPGAPPTILLSYGYWHRQFGADPAAVGSTLRVDGRQREIIGVLPPGFALPRQKAEIYIPFQWNPAQPNHPGFAYQAIARLSPGAEIEQANADVERMIPMAADQFPPGFSLAMLREAGFGANVRPLKEDFVGDIENVLWVLLGTVGIVLLIACANVANLFLVRAEGRQREMAVRAAIGAARGQVARQFLLESVALGLLGGLAGLGLAYGGVRLLTWMGPESLPRLNEISLEPRVLAFTVGISLLSGVLFGLFPVFRIGSLDLTASLKQGGGGSGTGRERHRARHALVIAQMALALVLLAGSGLMIRSFQRLRDVDPGFANPHEVLTFRVVIPSAEIRNGTEVALAYEQMWRGLRGIPGVTSIGASTSVTMDGRNITDVIWVEDAPGEELPMRRFKWITEGYFEAMRNPVLAGRPIEWSDIHDQAPVVVVTENFANEYWENPAAAVGRRIATGDPANLAWQEIVGVVGNVHDDGLSDPAPSVIFWPMRMRNPGAIGMAFAVRTTARAPSSLLPEVQAAIWSVNPNLPLAEVRTLEKILDESMARTSFILVVLAIAAAVALALGVVGIYGVISYVVSQRTREIGVRMALGANRRDVSRMVLRQGMILAVIGVVVGLIAAVGLTRLMSSLLYGVEATDPVTFGVVATMLVSVALAASYVPALRAGRTDPLEALRFG